MLGTSLIGHSDERAVAGALAVAVRRNGTDAARLMRVICPSNVRRVETAAASLVYIAECAREQRARTLDNPDRQISERRVALNLRVAGSKKCHPAPFGAALLTSTAT